MIRIDSIPSSHTALTNRLPPVMGKVVMGVSAVALAILLVYPSFTILKFTIALAATTALITLIYRFSLQIFKKEEASVTPASTAISLVRPPTHSPGDGNPCAVMHGYFNQATDVEQKTACFSYLLQYQHYNADYTRTECASLEYPLPLISIQDYHGYFRTEFHRQMEVLSLLLTDLPNVPFSKDDEKNTVKPMNLVGLKALQLLYSKDVPFVTEDQLKDSSAQKKVIFIPITPEDLTDLSKAIGAKLKCKLGSLRVKHRNLYFLILLQFESTDVMVAWGMTWQAPKTSNDLKAVSIEDIFEKGLFTLLNKLGAVPDRFEANRACGLKLNKLPFDQGVHLLPAANPSPSQQLIGDWKSVVQWLDAHRFNEDPGCELIRRAVVHWHTTFFEKYNLVDFASPLLLTQVAPWLCEKADLVKWAKGYQNLCEVALFCIHYSPHQISIQSVSSTIQTHLGSHLNLEDIHLSTQLFPYAMLVFYSIVDHIVTRKELTGKQLSLACVSQNYFEILGTVEIMAEKDVIKCKTAKALHEIKELPDILIVDIHPNNAAQEELFQNDVERWVHDHMERHPEQKLILILDITMNQLSDPVVVRTLGSLLPLVRNERLEIFCIQSLAKLVQFGADNFSGGLCLYFGSSTKYPESSQAFSAKEKEAFFSHLLLEFPLLQSKYFTLVRRNTEWMYKTLKHRLSSIDVHIKTDTDPEKQFSAAFVTQNVDDNTVYVAINFKPLLDILKIAPASDQEKKAITFIQELMLTLARLQKLPITGRQSFGFTLSNMTDVCHSIRFSIGIESKETLKAYADLIEETIYFLSLYIAIYQGPYDVTACCNGIEKVFQIAAGIMTYRSQPLPLNELCCNEDGEDDYERVGTATLSYIKKLELEIVNDGFTVHRQNIGISNFGNVNPVEWTPRELRQLFFKLHFSQDICVVSESKYGIGGLYSHKNPYIFMDDDEVAPFEIQDAESMVKIQFTPTFHLTTPDGNRYLLNQVFADISELGQKPVRLDLLFGANLCQVYTRCLRWNFTAVPYETNCVLVKFTQERPTLNYFQTILGIYKSEGLQGVVNFVNTFPYTQPPLPHNYSWHKRTIGIGKILQILHKIGAYHVFRFGESDAQLIQSIQREDCRAIFIKRMFYGLLYHDLEASSTDPTNPHLIIEFFLHQDILKSVEVENDWIGKWANRLIKYLKTHPDQVSRVQPYIDILLALISNIDSFNQLSKCSEAVALQKLSVLAQHKRLQEFVQKLEDRCIDNAKLIKKMGRLTYYLELYVSYPWLDEKKQRLLSTLSQFNHQGRKEWISSREFYYYEIPEERFEHGMIGDHEIVMYNGKARDQITEFYQGIGGKQILLELLREGADEETLSLARRWATITQDNELLSACTVE